MDRFRLGYFVVAAAIALSACQKRTPPVKQEPLPAAAAPLPATSAAAMASVSPASPASATSATSAAPPPPPDAKRITVSRYMLDEDAAARAWIGARVEAAKAGQRERVRVPLVRRSEGWGCVCPPHYLGGHAASAPNDAVWLDVSFAKGVRPLKEAEVVMAEGTFGAPMKHVSYPDGPPPTGRWEYDLVPFTVVRTAPLGDDDDVVLERL